MCVCGLPNAALPLNYIYLQHIWCNLYIIYRITNATKQFNSTDINTRIVAIYNYVFIMLLSFTHCARPTWIVLETYSIEGIFCCCTQTTSLTLIQIFKYIIDELINPLLLCHIQNSPTKHRQTAIMQRLRIIVIYLQSLSPNHPHSYLRKYFSRVS